MLQHSQNNSSGKTIVVSRVSTQEFNETVDQGNKTHQNYMQRNQLQTASPENFSKMSTGNESAP